jgi:predicted helicase
MTPDPARLRSIKTFPQLVAYLRDELDWPIATDDFDDLTFEYSADELGLDHATAVKIKEIKQLRPLSSKQPWGIFFVNFEPKRLPVVALRRILSTLVLRKRHSANQAQRASWKLHDLLFISSYGESEHREITFAHFSEDADTTEPPTLRVLGWDDEDTKLHVDHVEQVLKDKLRWPSDVNDLDSWRAKWSSGFTLRHREVITTSKALAERLADLARSIRKRANTVLKVESDKGPLRKLHDAFKETLVHDLSDDDFADMYAQTISYGLLTARVSRPTGLVAGNLSDMVPVTNPFLKELLETFLTVGGRKGKIDFDELGIIEVVQLLRDADMEAVLRDFGDRNPDEDPAIHFYELFLKEYDPEKRMKRGVFYTPLPVVSFIVRSVDEILRKEFGLQDGLADTATWGEMEKRHKDLNVPEGVSAAEPFVKILDPATGTGTFLVEVIEIIHETMLDKWRKEGHMALEFQNLWNEYVPKHLLPRLYGFELMMAPYAIAHMKIGLKLFETGYQFGSKERARIYLTNTLEEPKDLSDVFESMAPALAHEVRAVNNIKRHRCFTAIVGNPPYSGESANNIPWVRDLVNSKYQYIEGKKVEEKGKKNWLLDDYVKFIRYSHSLTEPLPAAVIGLITNHSYLDNPTFRGMRYSLMRDFTSVYLLDLHGNYKKGETCPDGSKDENVFDIQQGVCIGIFVKSRLLKPSVSRSGAISVLDLWGLRDKDKYPWLSVNTSHSRQFSRTEPDSHFFFFKKAGPRNEDYQTWPQLNEIFGVSGNGIITAHDDFSIAFDDAELSKRLDIYTDTTLSDPQVLERLHLRENSMWTIGPARKALRLSRSQNLFVGVLYRPFDIRRTFFHKSVVFNLRLPVMKHMVAGDNLALICSRMTKGETFAHVFVSRVISEAILLSSKTSNNAFCFPLNLREDEQENPLLLRSSSRLRSNLSTTISCLLSSEMTSKHSGGSKAAPDAMELFNYVYAILHSPTYRKEYAEFLKVDFPRLPLSGNVELFRALAHLGKELVGLHLLEQLKLGQHITKFVGQSQQEIDKISYSDRTVWIDKSCKSGFKGVPEAVWHFHTGGYQVCEKWLKDRKGRVLSKADTEHYYSIVVALHETIRLMAEIDSVIEAHGGWPGAFVKSSNSE